MAAYATSYIKTTSATVTRLADTFTRNNIYTNGLITSSGGTWYIELKNNVAYIRDTISDSFIADTSNANTNAFIFRGATTATRLSLTKRVSGSLSSLYTTTTDTCKIAIKWNGTSVDVFENGVKVVTASAFTSTNLEYLGANGADVPKYIQAMQLYPTPLSDSDCISLTTL